MWPITGFKQATVGYLTAVTPQTRIKQAANESVDMKSVRQGHFHEKEKTPETQLKTSSGKHFFDWNWKPLS